MRYISNDTMSPAQYYLLILLVIFQRGLSELVRTRRDVTANLGDDVVLSCKLLQHKDVLQVTWQKVTTEAIKNMATYNERFGSTVNSPFQGHMEFKNTGLQDSSIIIRSVSRGDESCYRCLFSAYPGGAIPGNTCLKVYELHDPTIHITKTNSQAAFTNVSCSATGQPAPIVVLNVKEHLPLENSITVSVSHPNGTVTVTTTATVSSLPDKHTTVFCVVSLSSSDATKNVSGEVPASEPAPLAVIAVVPVCLIALFCGMALLLALLVWQLKKRGANCRELSAQDDPEGSAKTPKKMPLMDMEGTHSSCSRCVMPSSRHLKTMVNTPGSVVRERIPPKNSPERPDGLSCKRKLEMNWS